MEAIERITYNQDWITLLLLGILFLLVGLSLLHNERLRYLFVLPFDNYYILNEDNYSSRLFSVILFLISNLVIALFIYLVQFNHLLNSHTFPKVSFGTILLLMSLYWIFKYGFGKLVAILFDIKKLQSKWTFIKMSYFYSSNLYLLLFSIISFYFPTNNRLLLLISGSAYTLLLLIRYYHFINQFKREIIGHFFYFILYLCALELAPLLIALKIGF